MVRTFLSSPQRLQMSAEDVVTRMKAILLHGEVEGAGLPEETRERYDRFVQQYKNLKTEFKKNPTLRTVYITIALLSIGEGKDRSCEKHHIASQAGKRHLAPQSLNDLAEVIQLYGFGVFLYGKAARRAEDTLIIGEGKQPGSVFAVQCDVSSQLPKNFGDCVFLAGAEYFKGTKKTRPHYELTWSHKKAVIGVYVNPNSTKRRFTSVKEMESLLAVTSVSTEPSRTVSDASTRVVVDPIAEAVANEGDVTNEIEEEDMSISVDQELDNAEAVPSVVTHQVQHTLPLEDTLYTGVEAPHTFREQGESTFDPSENAGRFFAHFFQVKNRRGGQHDDQGRALWGSVCPRNWVITTSQNPQVSEVVWRGIKKEERDLHLSFLQRVRDMPAEMLPWLPEDTVLTMLQRDAVARNYAWTTFVRKMSMAQSALKNLPVYTTQLEGIDLGRSMVWRSAMTYARKMMQQSETNPPAGVTIHTFKVIYARLRHRSPMTATYLMLMWCSAARAVDIERMKVRDIFIYTQEYPTHVESDRQLTGLESLQITSLPQETLEMVPITLLMKRGKGAHFRGTYHISTAIPRQDAAVLSELIATRTKSHLLFPDIAARRREALEVIHAVAPTACVASIRRSAIQFLAGQGIPQHLMMKISGHTREETYHRYLGDGRLRTREDAQLQELAAVSLRPLQQPSN
ncbi:hypothetical protein, conserved [Angomonas deanei]|uniref:Uncharacterized protein n=1 Tax=Angomonas deanei TaxID=59799 RepID=A0A7G2CTY9_9TRYP|nr:hypothetical protein, conserved [Angomonas deanei]